MVPLVEHSDCERHRHQDHKQDASVIDLGTEKDPEPESRRAAREVDCVKQLVEVRDSLLPRPIGWLLTQNVEYDKPEDEHTEPERRVRKLAGKPIH